MRQHKFKICKFKIVLYLKIIKNIKLDKLNSHHKCNRTKIKKNNLKLKIKNIIYKTLTLQKIENQQHYLQQLIKKKVLSLLRIYLKDSRKYHLQKHLC